MSDTDDTTEADRAIARSLFGTKPTAEPVAEITTATTEPEPRPRGIFA